MKLIAYYKMNYTSLFLLLLCFQLTLAQKTEKGYYLAGQEGQYILLNEQGTPINNQTYEYVGELTHQLVKVQKHGKYGFIDGQGKEIISFRYNWVSEMLNGVAVAQLDSLYGLLDKKGNYVVPPKYEYLKLAELSNGLAIFTSNGKDGAINKKGKIIISNDFDYIGPFYKGFAQADRGGKKGLIDIKGKTVIPFEYDYLGNTINGSSIAFRTNKDAKMGLMDLNQNLLLPPIYEFVFPKKDGLVYLTNANNYQKGLASKSGKILLNTEYDEIHQLNEGLLRVAKDKKYGFANAKGIITIPLIYDEAEDFSEGVAAVLLDGKWGFINQKNETVLDFQWVGVMKSFHNGYAAYGKRNFSSGAHYTTDKWGLLDKKGTSVLPNKYRSVSKGHGAYFVVEINNQKLLINKNEEVIAVLAFTESPVQMNISNP